MTKFTYILFLLCFFISFENLQAQTDNYFRLEGYLDKEKLNQVQQDIEKAKDEKTIVFELNSDSANLNDILSFARYIYTEKADRDLKLTVFIDDKAIGPSAIIPFLADELYTSYFVSWGDIPLGNKEVLPKNILRNQVVSLIPRDSEHSNILRLMAEAMCDGDLVIADNGTLVLVREGDIPKANVISKKGETLVVNHNQIRKWGLSKGSMSVKTFRNKRLTQDKEIEEKETVKKITVQPLDRKRKPIEELLKEHIKFSEIEPNKIGYIEIADRDSQISQSTWLYIKTALDHYQQKPPIFIMLKLNTPGGEVFSAQKISDALQQIDTKYDIPIVAYIDDWAISAGAMIAYSSRFIAATKDASMGAAEPVMIGEGGKMISASEKVNSAIRSDFASRARFFDRNPDIAEAMVDKDIILVFRNGKIVRLDSEDQMIITGPNPDKVISSKGKLLTLNAQEMMKYGVADMILLPKRLEPITKDEEAKGTWPFKKELLSTNSFFDQIPNAEINKYQMDWRTRFFVLLATPLISSLLTLGLIVGFYLEINTPGFGFPGAIGLTCLFLIILSSLSLDIANWLEIIFFLAGIAMILLEIFVIPTGGILGVIGALFCIGGLFAIMLPGVTNVNYEFDTGTLNAAGIAFFTRFAWLCGSLVVSFIVIALLGRYISPNLAGLKRFVLQGHEQDAKLGYVAGVDESKLPEKGEVGKVLATLRPSGKVQIGAAIYDAVTSGSFIEKGEEVVVERLQGSVIYVCKLEDYKP